MMGSVEDFVGWPVSTIQPVNAAYFRPYLLELDFMILKTLMPELQIQLENKNGAPQYLLCKFALAQCLYSALYKML